MNVFKVFVLNLNPESIIITTDFTDDTDFFFDNELYELNEFLEQ